MRWSRQLTDINRQAVDEYWAIIRRTGEGLRLEGTQRIIGGEFKSILETHRSAFNVRRPCQRRKPYLLLQSSNRTSLTLYHRLLHRNSLRRRVRLGMRSMRRYRSGLIELGRSSTMLSMRPGEGKWWAS